MSDAFVEKIIRGKIKTPLRADFNLDKWNQEWAKIEANSSEKDKKVYKMGIIMDGVLGDIREALIELYSRAPKTNYEKLMISYIASSNRTSAVALKQAKATPTNNVYNIKIQANPFGDKQSIGEIAHGAVDGFQLAIRQCIKAIESNNTVTTSIDPINEMEFIQREGWLSQLYNTYLHLWQCVLWGEYDLIELDAGNKKFRVEQPKTPFELAFNISGHRKEKISAHKVSLAFEHNIISSFKDDKFIFIARENKKRVLKVSRISNATKELLIANTLWRMDEIDLEQYFPKEWLTHDYDKGFCLSETLNVMRLLVLIANSETTKYPEDDSAFNVNKLREFCPTIQGCALELALSEATDISLVKIRKILDFLTFSSSPTGDIWCQPLIKLKKNKYALLTSALNSPVVSRLFEHWASACGIELSEKGVFYEAAVVDLLNRAIKKNRFITDYDSAISKRIKLETDEEEIDLLARIDDLILIGEIKSIVTTDSEISKFRTSEVLQHAGEQVVRKISFIKENLQSVFERLNWSYDENKNYKFVGFIVNSSRIFVGHAFNSVPVIDGKILEVYFSSGKINLLNVVSQGDMKAIAWNVLYNNAVELKENFKKYIACPPQLNVNAMSYSYNEVHFPFINDSSYKVSKRYLEFKSCGILELMEKDGGFPVMKSADYESEIGKVRVSI